MKIIKRIAIMKGVWKPRNASGEYWDGVTVTKLWDGVSGELMLIPYLQIVKKSEGKADSYHKSKPLWRTAFRKNGLKVAV
jgi:hypothetical protein